MLAAVRATLDYCERWFGDYPYASLRIVEVPRVQGFGGRASAGVIALNERLFVENAAAPARINNVLRNTIHEVAHQWWGERLMPRIGPGEKFITESLAKYIEAQVLGQLGGAEMRERLNDYNRRRYFSGRAQAEHPETPLARAEAAHLTYGKGPLVLLALADLIGESQLNAALREFLEAHQHGLTATGADLHRSLRAAAPPRWRPLVDDWLADVVEYRMQLGNPDVVRRADGRYSIGFDLTAERSRPDGRGGTQRIAIDEPLTFEVLPAGGAADSRQPERHVLHVQRDLTRIELDSDTQPAAVVVDPDGLRIEADRRDNRLELPRGASG
nr:M1 family aminopeptidase [Lysobacter sp. CAU 1642]